MSRAPSFQPDWVSPPGDTIADAASALRLDRHDIAVRLSLTAPDVEALLDGRLVISQPLADALSSTLGSTPQFWLARERQYRRSIDPHYGSTHAQEHRWLATLPTREMMTWGWIPSVSDNRLLLRACFEFFDAPDLDTWRNTYRALTATTAFKQQPSVAPATSAIAAWLRQGERVAARIPCAPWNPAQLAQAIPRLRGLTRRPRPDRFLPELTAECAGAGVAIAVVRTPPGCRVSAATRFLDSQRAVIQLSFRYLTDDHFWFSLFHEVAHLLLHGTDKTFLEVEGAAETDREVEADEFASTTLIPHAYGQTIRIMPLSQNAILRTARDLGVSPGVVVGQLQHMGRIGYAQYNHLKRRYVWDNNDIRL